MAEPASFEELDRVIGDVLDTDTTDFFALAAMLGLDPKQDFVGADLSGTDFFRGELAGAEFTGADLRGANLAFANLRDVNLTDANIGSDMGSGNNSDLDLASARNLERTRNLALARARDLASARARARDLARDLASARARARDFALALERGLLSYISIKTHTILRLLGYGANLQGANLSGAIFEGTKVEGAIMTDCVGLSDTQIADLKERGAIFDDAPGERAEARVLVPR